MASAGVSNGESVSDSSLRIFVATDIHLGYAERDAIRGHDSINTFEEILSLAAKEDVDFVLLGGDLFHENKPSRFVLNQSISLLRKHCFNSRPIRFECLSDPLQTFSSTSSPSLNYEDLNLNIGLPVFSINGNHDDLTNQTTPMCALDLLHTAGLLNYFGKVTTLDQITVSPLLFRKGPTHVALYGFGAVHDERLHRLFASNNVQFLRPRDGAEKWFNILVLHQNRVKHGETNYIPEHFIPDFFDLVIWGHEHPCFIDPVKGAIKQGTFFVQPGSSVATSLSEGESCDKYVGTLSILGEKFRLKKHKLTTVRPFVFDHIVLKELKHLSVGGRESAQQLEAYLKERVESIIETIESTREKNQPKEPLIRLRVDFTGGYETFNVARFGLKFQGRVANSKDIVLWYQERQKRDSIPYDPEAMRNAASDESLMEANRVEDLVKKYFSEVDEDKKLLLLTETGIGEAVKEFVDKDEKDSISYLVQHQLRKGQEKVKSKKPQEESALVEILKEERRKRTREIELQEEAEAQKLLEKTRDFRPKSNTEDALESDQEPEKPSGSVLKRLAAQRKGIEDYFPEEPETSRRGKRGYTSAQTALMEDSFEQTRPSTSRGRGRGRGRGTSTRGRGRGRVIDSEDSDVQVISAEESDDEYRPSKKKSPPKKRGRK